MKKSQKIKNLIIILCFVLLISAVGIFAWCINPLLYNSLSEKYNIVSKHNSLIVHYISVGQGDAIVIDLPDGKVVVIDTGLVDTNVTLTNYITDNVLNTKKNKVIDYLILTHADTDHTGGAERLVETFDVKNIVLPIYDGNTEYYKNFVNNVKNSEINIANCENVENLSKNYNFEFFFTDETFVGNEASYVVKLTCFDKSFLFTGDISSDVELDLLEKYGKDLDCDVLKVAHHGSKYSSCDEFLEIVSPEVSVISCGKNSYGHPTNETLTNLQEVGSKIYRTDTHGNIIIAVGDYYNLNVLNENFKIMSISFDVENLVIVIDFVLFLESIIVFIKKEKPKRKA